MKKFLLWGLFLLTLIVIVLFFGVQGVLEGDEFGGDPLANKINLLEESSHFKEGRFHNTHKERDQGIWVNIKDFINGTNKKPPAPFPIIKPVYEEAVLPGLRAVWFGHASVLVEIDGYRVFFDPMLSSHAFPVKSLAPQRMNPAPVDLKNLPKIDAVMISHDHYDHLDMKTVKHLAEKGSKFFVGLGVGAHLEKWGIDKSSIKEMDWGDSVKFKGLVVNCTQARHYSGRKSMSRNTLWASWVVQGVKHSVFHSGDSGYSDHFKEIGERFKNIDMSFIKVGDYGLDLGWQDIHMLPENSVQAHVDLRAKQMIPIHWGVFTLSNHPWDEPIERTVKAATGKNIVLRIPKIGEVVETKKEFKDNYWWRDLKSF